MPPEGSDWIAVVTAELPLSQALSWASRGDCGAVVTFCGTVRDHSEGRPGVVRLEYEAYEPYATDRLCDIARCARAQHREIGPIVLLHRTGVLTVGELSVVVVVAAAHRADAFSAARFSIDAIKATVPMWKYETWSEGSGWATCSHPIGGVPGPPDR